LPGYRHTGLDRSQWIRCCRKFAVRISVAPAVAQLSPGNGNYIVTATVELGNNAASANSVSCKLLQGFQIIGAGTEDLTPLATYSRTMTLTGAATGGALKVACQATNPAQARNRVMTAVQVGTLHA